MPRRSGSGSSPTRARDITRVTEMIKAAAAEQLPVVHPEQPGFAGITIGQLSGPAHDPRELVAERGHGLDGDARLVEAVDLDRRDRPLAVRDRHVRQDGRPPREGPARPRRGLPARGDPRDGVHGAARRGDPGRGPRRRADDHRHGWITGFASYVVDPTDPFPEGSRSATSGRPGASDQARRPQDDGTAIGIDPTDPPSLDGLTDRRPSVRRDRARPAVPEQVAPAERHLGDRLHREPAAARARPRPTGRRCRSAASPGSTPATPG